MIDTKLIDLNSSIANQSLAARQPTDIDGLWQVKNFFGDALLAKLRQFVNTVDPLIWVSMENNTAMHRKRIAWCSESVIEETHDICACLTAKVRSICPTAQHYWGINLWKDDKEYYIDWHLDNPDIDLSLQIYLFGDTDAPGTVFQQNDKIVPIDFISNSGYAVVQTPNPISHKLIHPVLSDAPRYSLHIVWSRFSKTPSDAN